MPDNPIAQFFRAQARTATPTATMAYGVETVEESLVLCTKPPCREDVAAGEWLLLNQGQLDQLAIHQGAPVTCDRCGCFLTEIVNAPDPRD